MKTWLLKRHKSRSLSLKSCAFRASEKGEHRERALFSSWTDASNTATEERASPRAVFRSVGISDAVSGKLLVLTDTTGSTVVVDVALAHSFESLFAERFCHAR